MDYPGLVLLLLTSPPTDGAGGSLPGMSEARLRDQGYRQRQDAEPLRHEEALVEPPLQDAERLRKKTV